MRAARFDRFGDVDVLHVTERPDPPCRDGEAVVSVKAASVNPSDVKNIAGLMEGTVLPRTPGRDFAGVVVAGPPEWIDAEVWGTGGEIGYQRDGSHAELIAIPVEALVRKPERLTFEEASVSGVTFITAWLGAVERAHLLPGESIAVFGVSGGVGGAAAQIARTIGAHVIGVGRDRPAGHTPAASSISGFVELGDDPRRVASEIAEHTSGQGAHVVFDTVGGVTTAAALASLAHGGRLVVISAVGTRTVGIDLVDFYHNESHMVGCDSRHLDAAGSALRLERLLPHFEAGEFRPLPVSTRYDLEAANEAYAAVADRAKGVVIRP